MRVGRRPGVKKSRIANALLKVLPCKNCRGGDRYPKASVPVVGLPASTTISTTKPRRCHLQPQLEGRAVPVKPIEHNDGTVVLISAAILAVAVWLVLNPSLSYGPICDITWFPLVLAIFGVFASVVRPARTDCNIRPDLEGGTVISRQILPAEPFATVAQKQPTVGGGHHAAVFMSVLHSFQRAFFGRTWMNLWLKFMRTEVAMAACRVSKLCGCCWDAHWKSEQLWRKAEKWQHGGRDTAWLRSDTSMRHDFCKRRRSSSQTMRRCAR